MNNKIILSIIVSLLLISFVGAAQTTLGTFKQSEDINVVQICGDCSYVNITSITYPNSSKVLIPTDTAMTKSGAEYTYLLGGGNTSVLGEYFVNGVGDLGGIDTAFVVPFTVTKSGTHITLPSTIGYGIIILIILFVSTFLMAFSHFTQNPAIKLFMIMVGFATLLMGIGTGIIFAQNIDLQSSTTNMINYLMFSTTFIFIIMMFYIFIQQTRRALELMKARKGWVDEEDINF